MIREHPLSDSGVCEYRVEEISSCEGSIALHYIRRGTKKRDLGYAECEVVLEDELNG